MIRDHGVDWRELTRIGLVAVLAALTWFQVWRPLARLDLLAVAGVIVGGLPIYEEALSALFARRMTMELSMTIAIGAAAAIGELFTALVIVLFVLVAEVLESITVGRGRRAIQELVDLLPRDAIVRRAGREERVESREVRQGEVVVVTPGARIPVDGTVTGGRSFADESSITGEPMPVEKLPGARVFAGTINQSGALEVEASGIGRDTVFGRIIEAVERAERSRAPRAEARRPACGLPRLLRHRLRGADVPDDAGHPGHHLRHHRGRRVWNRRRYALALLGGIGRAARAGAIIKGGLYLETLGRVDTVVFDKTGTITLGKPVVTAIEPAPGVSPRELLEAGAMATRRSEHPVAKAILKRAHADSIEAPAPDRFESFPGRGVACVYRDEAILAGSRAFLKESHVEVDASAAPGSRASEILVARGGRFLGSILVADRVRPDAADTVAALRSMGLRTVLLTGDTAAQAELVAGQVPLDEVDAGLLPEQKQARIRALLGEGRTVGMVGDGVNDAPALAEASVGVAMGSGNGRRHGERGCRPARRQPADARADARDRSRVPPCDLPELRGDPDRRRFRHPARRNGPVEPHAGRLHPRLLGDGLHPELGAPAAGRRAQAAAGP